MRKSISRFIVASAIVAPALLAGTVHAAAIPIAGGYTQNFNSLSTSSGTWTQDSTLDGWTGYYVTSGSVGGGTATSPTTITASAGASTAGGLFSWGVVSDHDRDLGSVALDSTAGTQVAGNARPSIYYVAHFVNNTGSDLTSLSITYTGEQWRAAAGQAATQDLTFQYFVGSAPDFGKAPGNGGWSSDVAPLTFTATNTSASANGTTGSGVAGTTAPLVSTTLSDTLPLAIPASSDFYLRWRDTNDSSTDHGIGVDDLSVAYTLAPEPTSLAACGLAIITLARRRRA